MLSDEDQAMATGNMYRKSVKFRRVVFEICQQTDRQTDRHADNNTLHPYWEQNNYF